MNSKNVSYYINSNGNVEKNPFYIYKITIKKKKFSFKYFVKYIYIFFFYLLLILQSVFYCTSYIIHINHTCYKCIIYIYIYTDFFPKSILTKFLIFFFFLYEWKHIYNMITIKLKIYICVYIFVFINVSNNFL